MDELKQAERLRGQGSLDGSASAGVEFALASDASPVASTLEASAIQTPRATGKAGFVESKLSTTADFSSGMARAAGARTDAMAGASRIASSAPSANGISPWLRWGLGSLLLLAVFWLALRHVDMGRSASAPPAGSGAAVEALPAKNSALDERLLQARLIWQAGDDAAAQAAFEQILSQSADNRVALQALAMINRSQGQAALAADYYRRLLALYPEDVEAELGLLGLQAAQAPQAALARLQQLMAAHPADARLPYALGNLEAAQQHWREAQQAYLQAYRLEPEQPDILFNLAVSSDALAQRQPAARFYQLALEAAAAAEADKTTGTASTAGWRELAAHKVSFDQQRARARLAALRGDRFSRTP